VLDNTLRGRAMTVEVDTPNNELRHNWNVTGNTSDTGYGSSSGSAMVIKRVNGVTVQGNTQRLQKGRNMAGVSTMQSCHVTVSGNQFEGASQDARVDASGCPGATNDTVQPSKGTTQPSSGAGASTSSQSASAAGH
jgi:hypothetical protein